MEKLILIGLPVHGNINPQVVACLIGLTSHINYPGKVHLQSNCYVHDARNKIVSEALKMGASHVMFIDADIAFPPDGVNRLMKEDKDIIGGLYYRRQPPHLPVICQRDGDRLVIPKDFPKDELFEVFGIATGFLLVKTSVFKKLEPPYFYFGNFKGLAMGEDIYFCRKAQDKGFKVWCDPRIPLSHIGEYAYDSQDYINYNVTEDKEALFEGSL